AEDGIRDRNVTGVQTCALPILPPEPPAYRVLTGVVDGFGRTLAFHRAAEGDVAGAVTGVTDGAGRRFHLVLTTQAQRAEVFRKQERKSGVEGKNVEVQRRIMQK